MKTGWEYSTIGELCNKMNGFWKGKTGKIGKKAVNLQSE